MKILFGVLLFVHFSAFGQTLNTPKLVVGIVIDQMRYDYLYKYKPFYVKGGFNRLMNEGSNFTYAHINYVPTSTAPGHASIYTGTSPAFHGIIANDWWDRGVKKYINNVEDTSFQTVGASGTEGQASPLKLLATTMTDQLRLATNMRSKTISVSLKDRGAILPGGRTAKGVYWYDDKTGRFITSSYYMNSLSPWVESFNEKRLPDTYLKKEWVLSLPETSYSMIGKDNSDFENDVFNEGKTSFPHSFKNISESSKYDKLRVSPYGNSLVAELAKQAVIGEKLGKNKVTDFLAVSFSSTDMIGHQFGTASWEIQDTYIKLDSTISDFLKFLDEQIGKDKYLLFLTADHSASETPALKKEIGLPAGGLGSKAAMDSLRAYCGRVYGDSDLVENVSNFQVFLSQEHMASKHLSQAEIERVLASYLKKSFLMINNAYLRNEIEGRGAQRDGVSSAVNGFHTTRSGDILLELLPGYLQNYTSKGTNHGTGYSYDTHIPLLFYGWHVPKQTSNRPVYIVDIAPTICDLLKITEPDACIGIPLLP